MRTLSDVETAITDVQDKIHANELELRQASNPEDITYHRRKDVQLNDQLIELLKERNSLGNTYACICESLNCVYEHEHALFVLCVCICSVCVCLVCAPVMYASVRVCACPVCVRCMCPLCAPLRVCTCASVCVF
jgi:hypothetical protein